MRLPRRKWRLLIVVKSVSTHTEGREIARDFQAEEWFYTRAGAYAERDRMIKEIATRDRYVAPERWVGPHLDMSVTSE